MIRSAIIAVLICGGCATGKAARINQPRPASVRNQHTAEERLAAQRAADPLRHDEETEARWGHAKSQERKQQKKQQAAPQPASTGPADVKKSQ